MRFKQFFSKGLALTASISLAAIGFAPVARAASPAMDTQQTSSSDRLAQGTTCAVVTGARGGLNVRAEPNTDSAIIDVLWNGEQVDVMDSSLEGWVALSGPGEAYVFSDYLDYCY
mgnify:CR=1 FL=1